MKKKAEITVTLTPDKAMTTRYALKKSVCYSMVKLARSTTAVDTTIYLMDENGIEWGSVDIHKGYDSWLKRKYYHLSFEYVAEDIDVATTYDIDVYKNRLDKELSEYEVNRY